jgi:hypothetical protein
MSVSFIFAHSANHSSAILEDLAPTLTGVTPRLEALEAQVAEIRYVAYYIETMMRAVCLNSGIQTSALRLRVPPVPLFGSPGPTPSSASSVVSTATASSTGVDIAGMSLMGAPVAGPSGGGAEIAQAQGTWSGAPIHFVLNC